jgi:hypothetical protein
MVKTTVYVPEALRQRVKRVAAQEGRSEAEVIRAALEEYTASRARPRPRLPLFESGKPDLVARLDDYLRGFGEA